MSYICGSEIYVIFYNPKWVYISSRYFGLIPLLFNPERILREAKMTIKAYGDVKGHDVLLECIFNSLLSILCVIITAHRLNSMQIQLDSMY